MRQHGMDWPIAVLDYEASSLDPELSYPVEVGIALWRGPVAPVIVWGSRIGPSPDWVRNGIWTQEAQDVHGIAPADLVDAPAPGEVLRRVNALLDGVPSVISDNPWWEEFWTHRIEAAAGACAAFVVDALRDRLSDAGARRRNAMADYLEAHPRPHRAKDDAARLVLGIAKGLGFEPTVESVDD